MRTIKSIAAVALLCAGCAVSFKIGKAVEYQQHVKDYEAACLQADFIRYIIDEFDGETEMANIGMEIENTYEEYFQELDNPHIFKTKGITSIEDLNNYYWCY
jgi:hypothetical protein